MYKLTGLCFIALLVAACGRPVENTPGQISDLVAKGVQTTLTAQSIQQAIELGVQATLMASQPPAATASPTEIFANVTPTRSSAVIPFRSPPPSTIPVARPSATPTATPVQDPRVITTKAINLRAGPGTNYPAIGAATANHTYSVTGRNSDGSWFEICCQREKPAWVSASVVTVTGDVDSVALARDIPPAPTAAPPTTVPSPVPQPMLTPPPDWVEYRQPEGLFAFYHPPTWQEGVPFSGGTQFAILEPYHYFSVEVYPEAKWRGKTDVEIQRAMVELTQAVAKISGNKFTLISQSRLPANNRTNSIQYTSGEGPVKGRDIRMIVILPDGSAAISVTGWVASLGGKSAPITNGEAQMIASSFWKP